MESGTKDKPFAYTWLVVLLVLNAVTGVCLLEYAWARIERHRNTRAAEINEYFPLYYRLDAQKWAKWKLYPGAMFLCLPRLLIGGVGVAVTMICISRILRIGHYSERPLKGCRKIFLRICYKIMAQLMSVICFFTFHFCVVMTDKDVNYEEFLGPNYLGKDGS